MDFLNDRRVLLIVGAAVALLAGVAIAWALIAGGRGEKTSAPPASEGGLVIDSTNTEDGRLDPARPLRCFVAGQFVGELTLAQCAERNGVATGALDVGVDETGALAATQDAGTVLTPLPPIADEPAPEAAAAPVATPVAPTDPTAAGAPTASCWRYADSQWRKLPTDLNLAACAQALFAGRCERQGGATYGRWAQQTLRLVPGKVEISGDNHSFRPLVEQGPNCSLWAGG
ncbi:MAG: hypothetical protein ABW360_12465 [Phenylobacterium sp.]